MSEVDSTEPSLSPTLRQHLATIRDCERSGEPMKHYAARRGLSIHTLYQAKKALRQKGVLPSADVSGVRSRRGSLPEKSASRFVDAIRGDEVNEGQKMDTRWRVRWPGGVVFESNASMSTDEMLRLFKSLSGGHDA